MPAARCETAFAGGQKRDEARKAEIAWIYPAPETLWIFDRLAEAVAVANARHFGFDLDGLNEGLQFTEYTPGDHYRAFHQDRGASRGKNLACRKLSFMLELSHPDAFQGGNFEILNGKKPERPNDTLVRSAQMGRVIIFPSFLLHRVTPIKSGRRETIVGWVSGPTFR